jgi:predicted NAD/FAD-dependent oxidoreductase
MDKYQADVLIIGAGMAGLSAARRLQTGGLRVLLLEKEPDVGGRLATQQVGGGRADAGAQFFTARTPDFQAAVDDWLAREVVYEWSRGWLDGSLSVALDDGHPRYAVSGGFSALATYVSAGLDVRLSVQVASLQVEEERWVAVDQKGHRTASRALLLTPPVPQSLALLKSGGVRLAAGDRRALERLDYAPNLCGLFLVEGPVHLPEPGALQRPHAPISWIADNQVKGISPAAKVLTVHANGDLSRALWEAKLSVALAELRSGLDGILDKSAVIVEEQLTRWRYATPTTIHAHRCLAAQNLPALVFAGDAFGGPRVEGAALSGWAAAAIIKEYLASTR